MPKWFDANGTDVDAYPDRAFKDGVYSYVPQTKEAIILSTLGEEYPKQQARVREILGHYKEIGPAGRFGSLMIDDLLRRADQAAIAQDLPAMIRIYEEMKQTK